MVEERSKDPNPFLDKIRACIEASQGPLSEYDLHRLLASDPLYRGLGSGKLGLFRRHFFVMNALYELQESYRNEGVLLAISALKIELRPMHLGPSSSLQERKSDLASWYRNWENYESATEATVEELLSQFWRLYESYTNRKPALEVLGLSEEATPSQIRRRYRRLVLQHHPDRGGNRTELERVQRAWQKLKGAPEPDRMNI